MRGSLFVLIWAKPFHRCRPQLLHYCKRSCQHWPAFELRRVRWIVCGSDDSSLTEECSARRRCPSPTKLLRRSPHEFSLLCDMLPLTTEWSDPNVEPRWCQLLELRWKVDDASCDSVWQTRHVLRRQIFGWNCSRKRWQNDVKTILRPPICRWYHRAGCYDDITSLTACVT